MSDTHPQVGETYEVTPDLLTRSATGINQKVQILSGLSIGDLVVTQSQFMLDSESRVQEAIANAVIHAEPKRVTVLFEPRDGGHLLEVHDDGVGIDPRAPEPVAGHLGLRSMAERAAEHDGTFTIERSSRTGTDVRVWIPAPEA